MQQHKLLAVVPARGGSKGLPRKNARSLCGHPLLFWTAEAFRRAAAADARIVLSTDDEELSAIGRGVGLEVPFRRPDDISGDQATAEAVALHALDWFERVKGVSFRSIMWLQPTSPFRPPEAIRAAVQMLDQDRAVCVIGVKAIYRTPATLFHLGQNRELMPLGQNHLLKSRRQEVEPLYTPNGAMYLVRTEVFRREGTFFPAGATGLVMDDIASIDIDTPVDWSIAESIGVSAGCWLS